MVLTLVLFAVAALGGLVLASIRLRGKNPPLALALVHGAVAAAGLVALIVAVLHAGASAFLPRIALALFVIAALGGFVLFATHLRKKNIPVPLMLIHAVVAVGGFVTLLIGSGLLG
jgi:membrane protease YdiL (CAAX protease family)